MKQEKMRLSKLMVQRNICSRREADELIEKGWVQVDEQKVTELGFKVDPQVKIDLSSQALIFLKKKVSLILNKPVGFLSSPSEKNYPLALSLITAKNQDLSNRKKKEFRLEHRNGLSPAGRLDIDSKGLILFTQDGVLAKTIIGMNSTIEKEYLVRVEGEINESKLRLLSYGLKMDGKFLKKAKIKVLKPHLLQFILTEGKKRQIRRMCERVNWEVQSLKRVRIGRICLGSLKEGQWRYLNSHEQP